MEKSELKPAGVFHFFNEICRGAPSFKEGREDDRLFKGVRKKT